MIKVAVYLLKNDEWKDITRHVFYPVNVNHTLDESLDSGTVRYYVRTEDGGEIDPAFSKLKLTFTDDDGTVTTEYFYYTDSYVQKSAIKDYPLFEHTLQLTEPTKILERYFISGMSVTQPLTGAKKSVWNVVDTLLDTNPLHLVGRPATFIPDSTLQARLSVIESPEFKFSCKMTLWESLYDIGRYIGAVPRLIPNPDDEKVWNVVSFDFYGESKGEITDLAGYAVRKGFDEVQACSELETYAENLIGSDESMSSVTEPSENAWIGVRSKEIKLDDKNGYIPTQYPIYKICKLIVRKATMMVGSGGSLTGAFPKENIDITSHVVLEETYATLDNSAIENNETNLKKGNAIFYRQGEKNIYGCGEETPYAPNLFFKTKALQNAILCVLIKMYIDEGNTLKNASTGLNQDMRDLEFRIEYIPLLPTKITTVKSYEKEFHNALAYN